jgi:hypothetical protein
VMTGRELPGLDADAGLDGVKPELDGNIETELGGDVGPVRDVEGSDVPYMYM